MILKRDRYASPSRCSLPSLPVLSLRLPRFSPFSPFPPISYSSLIPHPCRLYTWPFVSPLRPTTVAPLGHPCAARYTYSRWTTLCICIGSLYVYVCAKRTCVCVRVCMCVLRVDHTSHIESREQTQPLPSVP